MLKSFYYYFSILMTLGLMGSACITPLKEVSKESSSQTQVVVDSLNISSLTITTHSISLTWNRSKLDSSVFDRYFIRVNGRQQNGALVLPNGKEVKDINATELKLDLLNPGTTYGISVTVYNKSGKVTTQDETQLKTLSNTIKFVQKGKYNFDNGETIKDFSLPTSQNLSTFAATTKGIYQFDAYISTSPRLVLSNLEDVQHIAASSSTLFYATTDKVYFYELASGTTGSINLPYVQKMTMSSDESYITVATYDSIIFLTPNLTYLPSSNFSTIKILGAQIKDFVEFPENTTNHYIATALGVYYYDFGSATPLKMISEISEKNYTSVHTYSDQIVIARSTKKNDPGAIYILENSTLSELKEFNISSGIHVRNIFKNDMDIIALVNKNVYISIDGVVYIVPVEANSAFDITERCSLSKAGDLYVTGQNTISVFTYIR